MVLECCHATAPMHMHDAWSQRVLPGWIVRGEGLRRRRCRRGRMRACARRRCWSATTACARATAASSLRAAARRQATWPGTLHLVRTSPGFVVLLGKSTSRVDTEVARNLSGVHNMLHNVLMLSRCVPGGGVLVPRCSNSTCTGQSFHTGCAPVQARRPTRTRSPLSWPPSAAARRTRARPRWAPS